MFTTLIAHEARMQAKTLATILGISVVLLVAGAGFVLMPVATISSVGMVMGLGAVMFLAIATPAYLLERYARSMYGRQGYLTHTLPVRSSTLYWAKVVWAFAVWLLATVLAVAFWLLVMVVQQVSVGGSAAAFFGGLREALAHMSAGTIALWTAWMVVGLFIYVLQFTWVVTFGMEERFRSLGLGGPVLVWVISYLVLQLVMVPAIFLVPLGISPDFGRWAFESMLPHLLEALATNTDPGLIPMGWLPLLLATIPVYVIWTLRSLRSHTSLR